MAATCVHGHRLADDHPPGTPCPWPECSAHDGNTQSTPGLAEFAIGDVVRDGVTIGDLIGTFWREETPAGWRWRLVGTRERLRP